MLEDLKLLFVQMSPLCIALVVSGLAIFAIFSFTKKLKFLTVVGFGLVVAGITIRRLDGANNLQLLYLCIICAVVLSIFFVVMLRKNRNKKLFVKVRQADRNTTVPINAELKDISLNSLKGQNAVAFTDLRPMGKIKLDGEIFEAKTRGEYITVGTKLKVIDIDKDNNIFVEARSKKR